MHRVITLQGCVDSITTFNSLYSYIQSKNNFNPVQVISVLISVINDSKDNFTFLYNCRSSISVREVNQPKKSHIIQATAVSTHQQCQSYCI